MFDPTDLAAEEFQRTALVHLEAIFRMAHYLVRDTSRAEDLVQETFLQAWKSFHRFDRTLSCRAWLCSILHHIWSHERRRSDRDRVVFDTAATRTDILVYDPPTPETLTEEEVIAAFDMLPETVRQTVFLADVEQLSYREVAAVLSVPMGTVMSRLNRGRKLLRHHLASYAQSRGIGHPTGEPNQKKAHS